MCLIHMVRENSQLHPIKRCTSGLKDKAHGEGPWRRQQRWKFWVMKLLQCILYGTSAWREQMSATNTWIHQFTGNKTDERQNVFISKVWHFWMASFSGLHVGPEWLTETLTSDLPSCWTWFHLRLWDINWWWQIFVITKHMNEQVCNEKYLLC